MNTFADLCSECMSFTESVRDRPYKATGENRPFYKRPARAYLLTACPVYASGALSFLRRNLCRSAADKKLIESHHGISLWQISDGNCLCGLGENVQGGQASET